MGEGGSKVGEGMGRGVGISLTSGGPIAVRGVAPEGSYIYRFPNDEASVAGNPRLPNQSTKYYASKNGVRHDVCDGDMSPRGEAEIFNSTSVL